MFVIVRSAFNDKELERALQNAIEIAQNEGYYLDDIKYSTCFDENSGQILRSAVLMFEEDDDEDNEYDRW